MKRILIAAAVVAIAGQASAMSVSFDWGPTKSCFDSNSPPFKLLKVPAGTKTLQFQMQDLNATDFFHGGGKVAFNGEANVPYGAFSYTGPCPPEPHMYRFTVKALDASGKTLATATAKRRFPK